MSSKKSGAVKNEKEEPVVVLCVRIRIPVFGCEI